MDKLINKSLDNREKLDQRVLMDWEAYYQGIDFKALAKDPDGYLVDFAKQFIEDVMPEYANRYIQLGLKFGQDAKKQVVEYSTLNAVKRAVEGFGSD